MRSGKEVDYSKEIKLARDDRAEQATIGRLYMAFFIALAGPLSLALMGGIDFDPSREIIWGVIATAPVGVLMGLWNMFRLVRLGRVGAIPVVLLILAIAAAAGTWNLVPRAPL